MYYALRLKINYISDAQMFPLLLPTKSTKEKTGIPDSVTYFHNFIYEVKNTEVPLYQILILAYY
jgi:catalase